MGTGILVSIVIVVTSQDKRFSVISDSEKKELVYTKQTKKNKGVSIMKNNFAYFKNTECEYFPCHKTEGENFNCLFCYCPLYALGDKCGGNFVYIEDGIKDCSNCLIPHSENGYSYIISKFSEISELAKKNRTK